MAPRVVALAALLCVAPAAAASAAQPNLRREVAESLVQLKGGHHVDCQGSHCPQPRGRDQVIVDLGPAVEREEEEAEAKSAQRAVQRKREHVASLLWLEGRLHELRRGLDDKAFAERAAHEQQVAGEESKQPDTARMLSKMREQMHEFAAPVYRQVVDEQLLDVAEKRQALLQEIAPTEPPANLAVSDEPIYTKEDLVKRKKNTKIRSARTGQVVFVMSILLSIGLLVYAKMAHIEPRDV